MTAPRTAKECTTNRTEINMSKHMCYFYNDEFIRCESLKKHLERVHKIANKQTIKTIQKPHLITRGKKARKRYFVCLECHEVLDRKYTRQYSPLTSDYEAVW